MVAVVGSNNHVELRKLNIGRDLGTSVEVLGGISPNDALVIGIRQTPWNKTTK